MTFSSTEIMTILQKAYYKSATNNISVTNKITGTYVDIALTSTFNKNMSFPNMYTKDEVND